MRTLSRWWTGLSPRRRVLLGAVALLVTAVGIVAGVRVPRGEPEPVPGRPGAVLLVPGYGGAATSPNPLATRGPAAGRAAVRVRRVDHLAEPAGHADPGCRPRRDRGAAGGRRHR